MTVVGLSRSRGCGDIRRTKLRSYDRCDRLILNTPVAVAVRIAMIVKIQIEAMSKAMVIVIANVVGSGRSHRDSIRGIALQWWCRW